VLENLIPVSLENSLRQVTASVFSNIPLIEPKRFQKFIAELNYQKFELLRQRTISLNVGKDDLDNAGHPIKDVGFRMINFNNEGRINKVIQVEQRDSKEKNNKDTVIYNFQTLKYPGWEIFKEDLLSNLSAISKEDNPFINAVSLNYVNEFMWQGEEEIAIEQIFNRDADFMSHKFFKSQNSSCAVNTEDYYETYKSIEQLEVVVSKNRNLILTNSQIVFEFINPIKFYTSIEDGTFEDSIEKIHIEIKNYLKQLFTEEVKSKINLL